MLRISNARVRTPLKYYSSGLGWPEFGNFELKRPQECEELAMPVHNRSFGLQQGGIEFFLLDFTTKNLQNIFRGENTSY